jgi:hypothetical protein
MNLIEIIDSLSINPRGQDEEYENTSDFLEWVYYNIYREEGANIFPILSQIKRDSQYESIKSEVQFLININNSKNIDNEELKTRYNNMKVWLLNKLRSYSNKD